MKERPILMNGAMVRATLAGTKTQTRRIMKPQPYGNGFMAGGELRCHNDYLPPSAILWKDGSVVGYDAESLCPFGVPGDQLWVRETWNVRGLGWGMKPSRAAKISAPGACVYAADEGSEKWMNGWRTSIHMPRAFSRITLEVTGVRVERLGEISDTDSMAEGIDRAQVESYRHAGADRPAAHAFRALWESINGPGSWDANPWVWVIEFKRVTP